MGPLLDYLRTLSPEARVAALGLLVGLLCNLLKRHPSLPAKWVPLASLALGFAASFVLELTSSLEPRGALTVALEALLAGSFPVAGHKVVRPLWVALLGEGSADKCLGQADPAPGKDKSNVSGDDKSDVSGKDKPDLRVLPGGMLVLMAALAVGCSPKAPPKEPESEKPAKTPKKPKGEVTLTFEAAYGEARLALRGCCLREDPILWSLPQSVLGDGVIAKTAVLKPTGDLIIGFSRAATLEVYEGYGYEAWVGVAGHELGHAIDIADGREPTELSAHAWAGCALRLSGHGVADYARLVRYVTLHSAENETAARDGYRLCGRKGGIPGSHAQRAAFSLSRELGL